MRIKYILCLFLVACFNSSENQVEISVNLKGWKSISINANGKSTQIIKRADGVRLLTLDKASINESKLIKKLVNFKVIEFKPNNSGFDLSRAKLSSIRIITNDNNLLVQGYESSNRFYLNLKYKNNNKIINIAGEVDRNQFKKIFNAFNRIRAEKIVFPAEKIIEIIYTRTGRPLGPEQSKKLLSIFDELIFNKYIQENIKTVEQAKKYGLAFYRNGNLKSGFVIKTQSHSYYLSTGRPSIHGDKILVWMSFEQSIIEAQISSWKSLIELERSFQ